MNRYQVILFDANNTLLGYEDPMGFEKRFAWACKEDFGTNFSPEDVRKAAITLAAEWQQRKQAGIRRASTAEQYRQAMTWFYGGLLRALDVPGDPVSQADRLYDRFIVREGFMPPYNDVRETLEALCKAGYRLGILSNYPPELAENLTRYGLVDYFDFLVVSSLVGLEKPDPAIFKIALEQAGCPVETVLYVGDDPEDDLAGAQQVGLDMALIDRFGRLSSVDKPHLRSLTDLLVFLEKANMEIEPRIYEPGQTVRENRPG